MLSKATSSTIFWVFGMTWPRIEPRSPGPLANTLLIRPMVRYSKQINLEGKTFEFKASVNSIRVMVVGNEIGDSKFKCWMRLFVFHFMLMTLWKAWTHFLPAQLQIKPSVMDWIWYKVNFFLVYCLPKSLVCLIIYP